MRKAKQYLQNKKSVYTDFKWVNTADYHKEDVMIALEIAFHEGRLSMCEYPKDSTLGPTPEMMHELKMIDDAINKPSTNSSTSSS